MRQRRSTLNGVCFAATAILATTAAQSQSITNEVAKLRASDGVDDDLFGSAVAISGDTTIVGAPRDDDNGARAGSAYVFVRDQRGMWTEQAKLLASDGADGDSFGTSVAISGDIVILGTNVDEADPGSAYVFMRDQSGMWTEQTQLRASDGNDEDRFGATVSISGNTAIVGAPRDDDNGVGSGSAYVFTRDQSGMWSEQAKLLASDGAGGDSFGVSVAISGDIAILGAYEDEDYAGSAYVFTRDQNGMWSEQTKLLASDGDAEDFFGGSVAISGDIAILGAYGDEEFVGGSAYVFMHDRSGTWTEQSKLIASDGAEYGDFFGDSVAVSGDLAIVGATGLGDGLGSSYIIMRDESGLWTEKTKLLASGGARYGEFGAAVAISGNTAIVGAPRDENDKGSAYVFNVSSTDPGPFLQSSDGLVSMEAEHFTGSSTGGSFAPWQIANVESGSNDQIVMSDPYWLRSEPGDPDAPTVSYDIHFNRAGTHLVWTRGRSWHPKSDAFLIRLDDGVWNARHINPTDYQWHWSRRWHTIDVDAPGLHTLQIRRIERRLNLDKIVITPRWDFTPVGEGPEESPRE